MKSPLHPIGTLGAILFALVLGCAEQQVPQDMKERPVTGAEKKSTQPIPATRAETKDTLMDRVVAKWTGDLPEAQEKRRYIRILTSYNKTNFFLDRGRKRGLEYELLHQYENFLNKGLEKGKIKTRLIFLAQPFEQLIPGLLAGKGDIAAAGLTITPAREKRVAFTRPYIRNVNEIVVTSRSAKTLKTIEDLSGKKVHVVAGSSYVVHLQQLNRKLAQKGRKPIAIVQADKRLEAEDLLQMVNAGIFESTVVDRHIAEIWSRVLKDIVLHKKLIVHAGGNIAWAVRKENRELHKSLDRFIQKHGQGTLTGNMLIKRYYKNTKWITNPLQDAHRRRLQDLRPVITRYSEQYRFDWIKIAALAFQESRFDQNAKSPSGALGIMQIHPKTAADPNVGIPDIANEENNIHAGIKYLAFLRDRYFSDSKIPPDAKIDFTFAAYNAGPSRINSLRRRAPKEGFKPNIWFFNVEQVARGDIGRETVEYVANINKYYIAYKSSQETVDARNRIRDKLEK
ncbi:transglycosylase SLT domain-containing protein [Thermodesulfobacteriota bacterium]